MNSLMWCLMAKQLMVWRVTMCCLPTMKELSCCSNHRGWRQEICDHSSRKHKEFKNRLIVRGEDGDMRKAKMRWRKSSSSVWSVHLKGFHGFHLCEPRSYARFTWNVDKNLKTIVEEAAGVDRLTRATLLLVSELMQLPHVWMWLKQIGVDNLDHWGNTVRNWVSEASSESWEQERSKRYDDALAGWPVPKLS